MTDNDIIKALECCGIKGQYICEDDCPMLNNGIKSISICRRELKLSALDLITRQKAEIKRLTVLAKLGNMRANDYREMRNKLKNANAEIERLQKAIEVVDIMEEQHKRYVEKAKAEAIKEFAERLSGSFSLSAGIFTLGTVHYKIDNLVKEMVGDV